MPIVWTEELHNLVKLGEWTGENWEAGRLCFAGR